MHGKTEERLTLLEIRETGTVGVMSTYGRYWCQKSQWEIDAVGDEEGRFCWYNAHLRGSIGCMEKSMGDRHCPR